MKSMRTDIKICEKCGQEIKPPKPNLVIGQKLYAFLKYDNTLHVYEVAYGTNKRSIVLKCFDSDGTYWMSTGFRYRHIGDSLFFTEKEAIDNPHNGSK